jgi:hypothetical protein
MRLHFRRLTCVLAVLLTIPMAMVKLAGQSGADAAKAKPAAVAKTWTVSRTSDGQPDLQGVWANNNATPLERPKALADRQFLTDEEVERLKAKAAELFNGDGDAAFGDEIFVAALSGRERYVSDSFDKGTGNYNSFWLAERDFDNRTALIVDPPDGRVPALTSEAQQRNAARAAARRGRGPADSVEDRPLTERCITFGMPDLLAGYNSYYQIAQTRGYVAIATERIHDVRIIPLDGRPHVPPGIRLWHGDSRGHWEGDTLVVDTTNFSEKTNFRGASENLHVIERFTRKGPNGLEYQITLSDPTTWTKPWTLMIPLRKSSDKIYEYACHEGNTGVVGVLAGARAQEKKAAEANQVK